MQRISTSNPHQWIAPQATAKKQPQPQPAATPPLDTVELSSQAKTAGNVQVDVNYEISVNGNQEGEIKHGPLMIGIGRKATEILKLLKPGGEAEALKPAEGEGSKFIRLPITMPGDPNGEWFITVAGSSPLGSDVNSLEEMLKQGINPFDLDSVKNAIAMLMESHRNIG